MPASTAAAGPLNCGVSSLRKDQMRPLRYSINVTLDGCCDHRAIPADEDLHRHATENLARADAPSLAADLRNDGDSVAATGADGSEA